VFLVDTNVISEVRKGVRADPGVVAFLRDAKPEQLFLPVQAIGEIRRGQQQIARRGDIDQAAHLENWLNLLTTDYRDRILEFDLDSAQAWGVLMSSSPQHPVDKQIAAIALIHDMTLVTRNTNDFQGTGVRLLNPFIASLSH
jgi:predicted nucleic acid-binding protein